MNIGIDVRVLARGTRTGVEEYTINLLKHLVKNQGHNFKLFYNAFNKADLKFSWLGQSNVEVCDFKIPNRILFALTNYVSVPKLDKLIKGVDGYFNPHIYPAPVSRQCRKVVTFHDLSFLLHSEYFSFRKNLWHRFVINARQEAQSADKIIAVSESTKADLIDRFKVDQDKIQVIYQGVDSVFQPISDLARLAQVRKKYGLPERFILCLSTIEPRKNIGGLIRAYEQIAGDIMLVIAGARGWLYRDIYKQARQSAKKDKIIFTGFIDDEDKPYLYNLADLFVYPSFFEGFGIPPLEAMACGVPTITSYSSSLPEVVGEAGIMIDPYNIDELAWAMEEVLHDSALQKMLKEKGPKRASGFSWLRCARETLNLFE